MVSGSQSNEGGRSPNSLFGSSETLQDNIKDLFWKLCQGSGGPEITVEAILRQVRQPGVNTSEETSAELVSYLENVASLLTGNSVRLLAKPEDVDSGEAALQHNEPSTQVYPVNTQLLAERFRQRQGTNANSNVDVLPPLNDIPLALPAPTVCTREKVTQSTRSPSSHLEETNRRSEKDTLLPEDVASVEEATSVKESCLGGSGGQKQSTEIPRENEGQQNEQKTAVVEAEPTTEATACDSKLMAFCSLLVGSTVMATVGSLTRNDSQTSTGNGGQCDPKSSSLSDEQKKDSGKALMSLNTRQDPDLKTNVASTSKEVGTQHEEVIDSDLIPCNAPVLHIETKHTVSENDSQSSHEDIPNAIGPHPKCVEQRKITLPENIESSIARALTSLRPDDETTCEKRHFFNLEDNAYQEAMNSIHEQIGEFDYHTLKQGLAKEYHHSLPKYEIEITHDQSHFIQDVTYTSIGLQELETSEDWRRSARLEVKRRIRRERTGLSKPDQGLLQSFANTMHKTQVPDLVSKHQRLSPKGADKTAPKEGTCVEDCGPCGSMQGKKRGHVEIQRLPNPPDRHEAKVEDNSRSRKKPKPQIAFGRRVYGSEKENKAQVDTKQQTPKNTSSDRKRPRSVAIDPLCSDLHKVDVSGPEDSYSNGDDSFIDTLVNVLLSNSTTKFATPDAQESSFNLGVEDPHQVEDVMHAPMLDIMNQKERIGLDNDIDDLDFVEELVNLFPIADVVLSSQLNQRDPGLTTPLKEGVIDGMDSDNRTLMMESSKEKTVDEEGLDMRQVVKAPTTELVVDSVETSTLRDQQNSANYLLQPQDPNSKGDLASATPTDQVCRKLESFEETRSAQENSPKEKSDSQPQVQALKTEEQTRDDPDHQESLQKTQHLLRFENNTPETPTSSDENLPAFETRSSATTSTSGSTHSQHRMKDQRHWKDFKKRNLVQRRERLYTKHGIFDPLLFTSSEVETTSESDFSTCYAKQGSSSSLLNKETLK